MIKTNYTQNGGFPLEEKTLDYMQTAYLEILNAMIGHFGLSNTGSFIIHGCELVAGNITGGMMYIDGELCPFADITGDATTKIAKIEVIEDAPFENGTNYPTYYKYTAVENSAGAELSTFARLPKVPELVNVATAWANITGIPNVVIDPAVAPAPSLIQRIIKLEEKNAVFQAGGGMVLWNKPANLIPTNWQEVVNWKGRIPVGMDNTLDAVGQMVNPEFAPLPPTNAPGRIGGKKTHKLIQAEIPNYNLTRGVSYETPAGGNETIWSSAAGNSFTQTINSGGGDQPHPILNPFRTVIFIEYIG